MPDNPDPARRKSTRPYPRGRLLFGVAFFVAYMTVLKLLGFPDGDRVGFAGALRFGLLAGAIFAVLIVSFETWRWRRRG